MSTLNCQNTFRRAAMGFAFIALNFLRLCSGMSPSSPSMLFLPFNWKHNGNIRGSETSKLLLLLNEISCKRSYISLNWPFCRNETTDTESLLNLFSCEKKRFSRMKVGFAKNVRHFNLFLVVSKIFAGDLNLSCISRDDVKKPADKIFTRQDFQSF